MTIPEGWRLAQMVPRIAEMTDLPPDSVQARLSGDSLHVRWRVPGPGLEGYLFPDTYHFTPREFPRRRRESDDGSLSTLLDSGPAYPPGDCGPLRT